VLIGECKWGDAPVPRQDVRRLLDHTVPRTVATLPDGGAGWRVVPALFARHGATPEAAALMQTQGGLVVDLTTLYADLALDRLHPPTVP
jgi:hypothetical protein